MAAPADYSVTIKVNDIDITQYIPSDSMYFRDYARQVSSFSFDIENQNDVTPTRGQTVVITAKNLTGAPIIFDGYIVELESKKRDNGVASQWRVECADKKIRLQKSVIDVDLLTGADTDILSALLSNAYPDLSSLFDFSTGVTGFAEDLELDVSNKDILEALNDLSDLTGGDWRLDNPETGSDTITFDSGTDTILEDSSAPYTVKSWRSPNSATVSGTGGNPDDNLQRTSTTWTALDAMFALSYLDDSVTQAITNLTFDYYVSGVDPGTDFTIRIELVTDAGGSIHNTSSITQDTWVSLDWKNDISDIFPKTLEGGNQDYEVAIILFRTTGTESIEVRLDNIHIETAETTQNLQWGDEPDDTDFDFDIQSGDEFGFDFDLFEGDFDDFNSITVIGGHTEVAIDWTYESDGDQDHFDLETHVDDITVYKNTNTDASPTWTAQTVGIWGQDDLTGDGGDKDVLYDETDHWLYFDSNPSNLSKSIRVTGNIHKPLRVRVEDVAAGDPVYATTIVNKSITSEEQAVSYGLAELEKKNAPKRLTFKTYEPGLKPGQQITVTDSARGLSESLKIQRIDTKWLGAKHAQFTVECGVDEGASADILIANNDKRSRENEIPAGTTVVTVNALTDDSGNVLTDDSGNILYQES